MRATGALLLSRKVELIDRGVSFSVGDLVNCGDLGMGTVEYFGPHAVRLTALYRRISVVDSHRVRTVAKGLVPPGRRGPSGTKRCSRWLAR